MKLTTFCALIIFAAMAQLKPSEGLNLEVSINVAKDIETDIGSKDTFRPLKQNQSCPTKIHSLRRRPVEAVQEMQER